MNKINNEKIMEHLQYIYDDVQEYKWDPDEDILGIFVYGKALYGFLDDLSDLRYVICYIVNNKDIYFGEDNTGHIDNDIMTDIRTLLNKYRNQDFRIMECAFSDYKIINPRYKGLYDKFINMNKERLFHFNPTLRLQNAIKRGYEAIDKDDLFEALRIQIASNLYLQGVALENCINIKDPIYLNMLESCKNGSYIPDKKVLINTYKELEKQCEENPFEQDLGAINIAEDFIIEVIKTSLKENISTDEFYKALTKSEKQAWEEIVMEINNYYGIVSISQLVEKSKLSRPVFKSTLDKMEKYGMAEIVNMGVKGTQITMLK